MTRAPRTENRNSAEASRLIAMIDGDDPCLREAQAMGLSVFAGEAEGRLDEVLRDADAGIPRTPLCPFALEENAMLPRRACSLQVVACNCEVEW